MHNDVAKLAIELYRRKGSFADYSKEDSMTVLRKELMEANGGSDKLTPKSFRNNPALFTIIEEVLDVLVKEGLDDQFDMFVETKELGHGETAVFSVRENKLFDVALISDGNQDIRRNRLDNGELTVSVDIYGVSIYEELSRMLAGRTDIVQLVDTVSRSYQNKIQNSIYNAIYNSYNSLDQTFAKSGSFTETELADLIAHVEAGTGLEAMIVGTKQALSKISYDSESNNSQDLKNQFGYYGTFQGTDMMVIKQAHKVGSYEWAIDPNFILVVPKNPDKFVKLVLEGDSMIIEGNPEDRNDLQYEYTFIKKAGVAVLRSSVYGIYRIA